jgi:hypothetical protein
MYYLVQFGRHSIRPLRKREYISYRITGRAAAGRHGGTICQNRSLCQLTSELWGEEALLSLPSSNL